MAQSLTPGRRVVFAHSFDECTEALGGHKIVDEALAPVIDALYRNPFAFDAIEIVFNGNELVSCRYAITKPLRNLPAIVVVFTIDGNDDVEITHAEEADRY